MTKEIADTSEFCDHCHEQLWWIEVCEGPAVTMFYECPRCGAFFDWLMEPFEPLAV